MTLGDVFLLIVGAYALAGALIAIPFVLSGVLKVDAAARRTPWRVRLLWAPGALALWPIVLAKWLGAKALAGNA